MPINIYRHSDGLTKVLLCDDNWGLPDQLYELENWLKNHIATLDGSKYIADIGFKIRSDASGGGTTLETEIMQLLIKANIDIYFSEYP